MAITLGRQHHQISTCFGSHLAGSNLGFSSKSLGPTELRVGFESGNDASTPLQLKANNSSRTTNTRLRMIIYSLAALPKGSKQSKREPRMRDFNWSEDAAREGRKRWKHGWAQIKARGCSKSNNVGRAIAKGARRGQIRGAGPAINGGGESSVPPESYNLP